MNVALIGCGLIGRKRAAALSEFAEDRIVVACDIDRSRADTFSKEFGCQATTEWEVAVSRKDVDVVVNSSVNDVLEPITVAALGSGKHVLCEKPLGRNAAESRRMVEAARRSDRLLKTGFNHIFHPALWKAKELLNEGRIGEIISLRARYGHGSRPGMEHEWRSSKTRCGGGELLDQGVHIIDLIRWYAGDIREVFGKVETKFWNIEVEDNAFVMLRCDGNVSAIFHVSWTNWKNVFSFEIFGREGYLAVNGLGGSYGTETLEAGRRKPEGGKPDIETFEFPQPDRSWRDEWKEFRSAIGEHRQPVRSGIDGLRANEVVEAIYESSRTNLPVMLNAR
ncbi:MAG TPA: Gfo/Idh/MocA family oxidoreductase [Bacteroidota bacterium]|nr:Gfo/Idh/MocA family oxidoreductase [Bacteroidota bacterium]